MSSTKILVVEDESIVALDIKSRLQNLGYVVPKMVATGPKAIKAATEIQPDIILMDIRLKGDMDGIQTAHQIRKTLDIPVIYLTAYADEITLQRAKITDSFGYLLKPFEERELNATIETALYKHKMERRLRENERWLHTTLRSIGDGVIATDGEGQIKFMNPVAARLTGWSEEAALGRNVEEVYSLNAADSPHPVAQALDQGQTNYMVNETRLTAKGGSQFFVNLTAAPIKDDQGHVDGVVLVFRDITAQKEAEQKLIEYADKLKAHNEELDAFAHTVAHDLQSPLGHIVSLADAMRIYQDTISTTEMTEYLDKMVNHGLKMSSIVDSLLLLAGVRRKETVETAPLDMSKIIADVQERMAHHIVNTDAELILPDSWPVAIGYGPWIEEVWANYIGNAIKYGGTPPQIKLGANPPQNGYVCFWVKDNGLGLTADEQEQLFVPFTQLGQAKTKGHGLGLSIVRRIIEKLGGTVGVESKGQPGLGSRFYFNLPAQ